MTKKIYLIIFALFLLTCLVGCADSANQTPTESPTEAKDESYRIEKIDGQYYIIFADESAFENPPQSFGSERADVWFSSVADMYHSLMDGTLSYKQKYNLIKHLAKDEHGYLLPNLDRLLYPVIEGKAFDGNEEISIDGLEFEGVAILHHLDYRDCMVEMSDSGGKIQDFFFYSFDTREKYEEAYQELYVNVLEKSDYNVKDRFFSEDGLRETIFYDWFSSDAKEIRYSLQRDGKVIHVREIYSKDWLLFDGAGFELFVEEPNGICYCYTGIFVEELLPFTEDWFFSLGAGVYND